MASSAGDTVNAQRKRAMVVFAHPCEESFSAALHTATVESLQKGGWEVDDCDLNAEGFNPILTAQERRGYHDLDTNQDPVRGYVDRLHAAQALIFVFPVWNFGYPAILKGFFDRVFLPGVSFKMVDGQVRPNLTHIQKAAAVTTYGGTRLRAMLCNDPPRSCLTRPVRYVLGGTRMHYLALYDMNRASQEKRASFLQNVRHQMERF
ncbi:MAG: NAD(P)H-dependent oxidoreductase [Devosiaceae bacterium]|nr:NAD(P)H-dependent oxidoreductase [Devosiaceae bacterium MH13]